MRSTSGTVPRRIHNLGTDKESCPDLVFHAYWGNENNTTAPTYRTDGSIWSGYDAVWHFSNYDDSSANDQNLTVQGAPQFSTNMQ